MKPVPKGVDRRTLLDVGAAAAYLGVSERWVRRAIFERRIAYLKVGHYVRFTPADLDAFLAAQRVEAVAACDGTAARKEERDE